MTEQAQDRFEIPQEMRSIAEGNVRRAREAFEKFVEGAEAAAGTIEERGATVRAGARDIGAKALDFAEKNVEASLDYAESLVHARDVSEVVRLHGAYVQTQMRALAEQAGEMGRIVGRAAMDVTRPNIERH